MLGLLDDVLIVPLGVWLAMRMIPAPLVAEYREAAARMAERPVSRTAAALIAAIWLALAALLAWIALR